ncbi:erythromycin esterase family protein [Hamadaea tsunoensis]|uniref:erythromycin esterase family protein n=1 Tax=Hamadaea tsunoensis TaxID=53368 RepID=UPI00041B7E1B|nr:erythromycin esterase family protein [Hamadaea tsunoensis]
MTSAVDLGPAGPLPDATIDRLAATIAADALIVGMGESTRFAHETFAVRDRLFRRLVHHHGVRGLAIQDSAAIGDRLDSYVTGGDGSAAAALGEAWRPWRTAEMAEALDWIRAFNQAHPDDPVRVFGVRPPQARAADYDVVLDAIRTRAPEHLSEVAAHLDPIRTAHDVDEHVQTARGLHPGRPFAEHARDALAVVASLGVDPAVERRMRLIVDFHTGSVAGRGSYAGDAETWAGRISDLQLRTGSRLAYWDGIAHTAATPVALGLAPERGAQPTVGSVLRGRHHGRYVSVAIGFHHGRLGAMTVPPPAADLVDATISRPGEPAFAQDLRHSDPRHATGPAKVRVISGVYDPARDDAEHMAVATLAGAFDVLIHIREVTPVRRLD